MQATFGGSLAVLAAGGKEYPLVVAQPPEACSPLQNEAAAVAGAVVLIQRGERGGGGVGWWWGGGARAPLLPRSAHALTPTRPPARRHVPIQREGSGGAGRGGGGSTHLRQRAAGGWVEGARER